MGLFKKLLKFCISSCQAYNKNDFYCMTIFSNKNKSSEEVLPHYQLHKLSRCYLLILYQWLWLHCSRLLKIINRYQTEFKCDCLSALYRYYLVQVKKYCFWQFRLHLQRCKKKFWYNSLNFKISFIAKSICYFQISAKSST